jgi:putative FmdB family regulatory protein
MPIYEYECEACGNRFELIQKFSDPLVQICPKCGEPKVHKLLSSPAFQFKGTGWYVTDYARKGGSGSDSSKSGDGNDGKSADKGASAKSDSASSSAASSSGSNAANSSASTGSASSSDASSPSKSSSSTDKAPSSSSKNS